MKILKKICPVCALISLFWLTLLTIKWLGYDVNNELLAMLMGGSAVGISYTLANKLNSRTMVWKLIAIPISLAGMYALLNFNWGYFLLAVMSYLTTWWLFKNAVVGSTGESNKSEMDIKNKLKNCC
ncbi:MAG: hypothetical protein AAB453_02110 [Patescibacteria group bacterium]